MSWITWSLKIKRDDCSQGINCFIISKISLNKTGVTPIAAVIRLIFLLSFNKSDMDWFKSTPTDSIMLRGSFWVILEISNWAFSTSSKEYCFLSSSDGFVSRNSVRFKSFDLNKRRLNHILRYPVNLSKLGVIFQFWIARTDSELLLILYAVNKRVRIICSTF